MLMNFVKNIYQALLSTKHKKIKLLLLVLGIFLLIFFFVNLRPPKAVIFDFKSTYNEFLAEAVKQKLPEEKLKILGKRFPEAVTYAVDTYVKKHYVIIYSKSAVFAGAEDVTRDIQELIAEKMQELAKGE
jgi:type-F conjugative transfer system protein TrbI